MAFLQSLGNREATGPIMIGKGKLGTSPPSCGGASWGVIVPAAGA